MAEKESFVVMKDLQGYFKEGQRKKIYNSAETLRDKVLIRLLWVTGRRISEILQIKVHEIDFELMAVSIHIKKKRFDKVSLSYLDKFTIKLLKYYIKSYGLRPDDYLFKSDFKKDSPISRQRAFEIVRKTCRKAGIYKVGKKEPHPHHFRHSFAVDLAKKMKKPEDVRKLQMALDHSSLAVTEKYLQFSGEEMRSLVEEIGD